MKHSCIRILVADDHSIVLEGLRALFAHQRNMKVVAEACNWPQTIRLALRHLPDLVLADLHMPRGSGASAISTVLGQFPAAKFVLFSAFDTEEEVYEVLRAGARGYVLKGEFGKADLLRCIQSVLKGHIWLHPSATAKLAQHISAPALTVREKEVLQLLVEGKSNKEIGSALRVVEGTVKVHVNHVFGKLGVTGRTAAITAALRRGLVRPPADS
jgi:two-component system NarL family response regulator